MSFRALALLAALLAAAVGAAPVTREIDSAAPVTTQANVLHDARLERLEALVERLDTLVERQGAELASLRMQLDEVANRPAAAPPEEAEADITANSASAQTPAADSEPRRRTQRAGAGGDAAQPRSVNIYTRQLSRAPAAPGAPSRGRRRRRLQAPQPCSAASVGARSSAVHAMCCDEPSEDCSGGQPHTCNADCAAVLLPYYDDCELAMPAGEVKVLHPVVQLCQASIVARDGESLAMQLLLSCDDGTTADECVPRCSPALHGDLLLANIDGEDSKYSCELHHSLFSWMGAASDGGFLGQDSVALLSSLLSRAAGAYDHSQSLSQLDFPGRSLTELSCFQVRPYPRRGRRRPHGCGDSARHARHCHRRRAPSQRSALGECTNL